VGGSGGVAVLASCGSSSSSKWEGAPSSRRGGERLESTVLKTGVAWRGVVTPAACSWPSCDALQSVPVRVVLCGAPAAGGEGGGASGSLFIGTARANGGGPALQQFQYCRPSTDSARGGENVRSLTVSSVSPERARDARGGEA